MPRSSNRIISMGASVLIIAILTLLPGTGLAKDDVSRIRFYGWVESRPDGFLGTWIVGGREIEVGPRTEFDQVEGPLTVGSCAKVDIRNGTVHEIDSEPAANCR